jgi:NADPH:quinone reductase-like Zn-dependent oxidoreductase
MRAARIHAYGPPSVIVLEDLDATQPGTGQVLVRVAAAGVGNWDALVRTGRSGLPLSLPLTLGAEVAGVVQVVGAGNSAHLAPTQLVYGSTGSLYTGGYAEYAMCSADMLAPKPKGLTPAQAASLPVAAVMAWQMVVEHARVAAGQTVVVHGAAGNVGAFAVQIACARGAKVTGTVREEKDEETVRALGATDVIRNQGDYARFARGAEVVIDTVGGRSQAALFSLVKSGGLLVSSVSRPDRALALEAQIRVDYFIAAVTTAALGEVTRLLDAGRLRARVGVTLPLRDARVAHEMLEGTRPRPDGKIVLDVE